jgi:deazaflavin-dependent oxidoreductase (nitroreductase family)
MSDVEAATLREARSDWASEHLASYLGSGGVKGHIVDVSAVGGHEVTTHCLIKYVGRNSGKAYVKALIYGNVGGELVVVASKGGADRHPEWYLNVVASPTVGVQVATQAFEATWREPEGAERDSVWRYMVDLFPPYAGYQASTARRIPLLMLKMIRPIEVFTR